SSINLNDTEKKCIDKLNCKFHGDFRLDQNPSTFKEAIELYQKLPSLVGADNENAVPKTVYLTPLHVLFNKEEKIIREISSSTINRSIAGIEDLHSVIVQAVDLTKASIFTNFPPMKEQLLDFITRVTEFEHELKSQMALLLPEVRVGTKTEVCLTDLLKKLNSSPFNMKTLSSWLKGKSDEITRITGFIRTITLAMSSHNSVNISIESGSVMKAYTRNPSKRIICLLLRLNREEEPQLADMYNYLYEPEKLQSRDQKEIRPSWFRSREIISKMCSHIDHFVELSLENVQNAKVEFVVDEECFLDGTERVDIVLYENCLEQQGYIALRKPRKPTATVVTHNSVTLEWTDEERKSESTQKYKIIYRKLTTDKVQWSEVFTSDNKKTMCITDLPSSTPFQFKVQSINNICYSPTSDISEAITTAAAPTAQGRLGYTILSELVVLVKGQVRIRPRSGPFSFHSDQT
ncbi:unnamed protein product, partial [Didymodactylos carnosus]